MKFNKEADGSFTELKQKNVDTGMGLERVLTIFNGKTNVYDTELFIPVMTQLNNIIGGLDVKMPIRDRRIICEHIRAVCFILGDPQKICPSNTEQGYILRRLIRRMIRLFKKADQYLEKTDENTALSGELAFKLYDTYGTPYQVIHWKSVVVLTRAIPGS